MSEEEVAKIRSENPALEVKISTPPFRFEVVEHTPRSAPTEEPAYDVPFEPADSPVD